jgi:AcrR family transcriptional regulator
VQHYFRTKDEMMTFAMAIVQERQQTRITARIGGLGADPGPRLLLRTLLTGVLPLDDESRVYGRVALAFLAYTAVRVEAAAPLREQTRELLGFVADLIRAGGAVEDPETAAAGLLAAMEGLGVYLLGGHFTPEVALRALDAHLDMIFTSA